MKSIYYSLIILLTTLLSCNNTKNKPPREQPVPDSTIISTVTVIGQWQNPTNNTIYIKSPLSTDSVTTINNSFTLTAKVNNCGYITVYNQKTKLRIFICPNDSISFFVDENDILNSLVYTGKNAAANNYIQQKHKLMLLADMPVSQLYQMPQNQFKYFVDSIYLLQNFLLDELINQNSSVPWQFYIIEQAAIKYNRATKMYEYPLMNTNFEANKSYFLFTKHVPEPDSTMLTDIDCKSYLDAMVQYQAQLLMQQKGKKEYYPYESTLMKLQSITAHVANPAVKNYLYHKFMMQHVNYYGYKNTSELFDYFDLNCTNTTYRNNLLEPYYKYKQLTQNTKAPTFFFEDINGKTYTLQNFLGQYLYIDVWATWCLPCRNELKHFTALQNKYKNSNVIFINLSVDSKHNDWVEYLNLKTNTTNNFRVIDTDSFLTNYLIKTIPHFILIDPNGKIVDANAPRPSDNDSWLNNLTTGIALN